MSYELLNSSQKRPFSSQILSFVYAWPIIIKKGCFQFLRTNCSEISRAIRYYYTLHIRPIYPPQKRIVALIVNETFLARIGCKQKFVAGGGEGRTRHRTFVAEGYRSNESWSIERATRQREIRDHDSDKFRSLNIHRSTIQIGGVLACWLTRE